MTRPTEPRLRTIVATGQWTTSWLIAVALVCVVLGIRIPEPLSVFVGIVFAVIAPTFLVAGMILCVRLPGWRKWIGLTANTFLVVAGVALMNFTVASSARAAGLAELESVRKSPIYVSTADDLKTAQANRDMWERRAEGLDATWISAAQKPAAEAKIWADKIPGLRSELAQMEARVTVATVSASSATDLFGPGTSGWLALILALSNEAIALALMWGSNAKSAPDKVRTGVTQTAQTTEQPRGARLTAEQFREIQWTAEERQFLGVKQELERQGLPSGYREVCIAGNMNLGACKRINSQILRKIETARSGASTTMS